MAADGMVMVLIDSGAFEHVCPKWFGNAGILPENLRVIVGAGNHVIKHFGSKEVRFAVWGKRPTVAKFEVCEVRRPILSVGSLNQAGIKAEFDGESSCLWHGKERISLIHANNLYYLPVQVLKSQEELQMPEQDSTLDEEQCLQQEMHFSRCASVGSVTAKFLQRFGSQTSRDAEYF